MRIAIVERYGHRSDLEYLVEVLRVDHALSVFARAHLTQRIDPTLVAGTPEAPQVHPADLLIAVTLTVDPRPWLRLSRLGVPMVALIHNAAWHFTLKLQPVGRELAMWSRQQLWKLRGFTARRRDVLDAFAGLVFPSADIANAYESEGPQPKLGLPWAIHTRATQASVEDTERRFVIAGGIDARFRDYATVLEAFLGLPREYACTLELLGTPSRPRDEAIVARFAERLPPHVALITYETYVAPTKYDARLASCTAILNPHRGLVPFAGYAERGGISKISGAENDQIRAGRTALVDARYRGMTCLAPCQVVYRNAAELTRALIEAIDRSKPCAPSTSLDVEWHRARWAEFLSVVTGRSQTEY